MRRNHSNYDYPDHLKEHLARCRNCYGPMYCIYDQRLRDFCHKCALIMRADPSSNLRTIPLLLVRRD